MYVLCHWLEFVSRAEWMNDTFRLHTRICFRVSASRKGWRWYPAEELLKYLPSHKNQVTMISCCKWNWLDSSSLPSLYGRFPGSLSVHFVLFMKLQVNGTQTCRVISSSVSSLGLNSSPDTMIGGPAEPPNKVSSGYLIRLRSLQSYSTPQAEISKSAGE